MRKMLVVLWLVAAPVTARSSKRDWIIVDGKTVVAKQRCQTRSLVEVSGLKYYDAMLEKTGEECGLVTGVVRHNFPMDRCIVNLTFHFHRTAVGGYHKGLGSTKVRVRCLKSNTPFAFVALAPRPFTGNYNETAYKQYSIGYTVTITTEEYSPPK